MTIGIFKEWLVKYFFVRESGVISTGRLFVINKHKLVVVFLTKINVLLIQLKSKYYSNLILSFQIYSE